MRPDAADAHNNLALLLETNRPEEAAAIERHYRAAIDLDANDADFRCNYAAFLAAEKRVDEAVAAYDAAVAVDPARGDAFLAAAELHAAAGRIEPALKAAKAGLAAAEGEEDAAAARTLLRALLEIWRDTRDDADVVAFELDGVSLDEEKGR